MGTEKIISRKEAIEKGLKRYFTGKPCKRGHVSERNVGGTCVECMKKYYQKNKEELDKRNRKWKEKNKESYKKYTQEYYQKNKDRINKYNKERVEYNKEYKKRYKKEWFQMNKARIREHQREYRNQNREYINEYKREWKLVRYETDPDYKTSVVCRDILRRTLKSTNSTKDTRTYEMLGYCNEQLKDSIESKFLEGMSWDNYGDWHVDHIYPVSRYIKDGVEDPAIINHLDNLIPMWAEHNMEKSDRTLEEYLEERPDLVELYGGFL